MRVPFCTLFELRIICVIESVRQHIGKRRATSRCIALTHEVTRGHRHEMTELLSWVSR